MVQVDVFWSYGLSAGLALAGRRRIEKAPSWWNNETFLLTVIWTACVFAPSGIFLLWNHPAWETMFVARDHLSIPAWLVTLFSLTNVTQGLLGFYVTARYLRKGNLTAAKFQAVWSHLAMLFILVVGWDGTGFRRFLYPGSGEEWQSGVSYPLNAFWGSPIFYSLLGLGLVFLPTYLGLVGRLRK